MQMCDLMTGCHRRLTTGQGYGNQPRTTKAISCTNTKFAWKRLDSTVTRMTVKHMITFYLSRQKKEEYVLKQYLLAYHCPLSLTSSIVVASQVEIMWPHNTGLISLLSPWSVQHRTLCFRPNQGAFSLSTHSELALFIKSGPTATDAILSKQSLMSRPWRRLQAHVLATALKYAAQSAGTYILSKMLIAQTWALIITEWKHTEWWCGQRWLPQWRSGYKSDIIKRMANQQLINHWQ